MARRAFSIGDRVRHLPSELFSLGEDASGETDLWMVEIPAGRFLMGSPASERDRNHDETQHEVTISKAFWLGQTPVTQGQYLALMGSNPSEFQDGADWRNRPVERVTWYAAVAFCNSLTAAVNARDPGLNLTPCYEITEVERDDEGTIRSARVSWSPSTNGFRLPTEAEWEYACRAGTQTRYSFGDDEALLGKHAWFRENSNNTTHPVATRRSNGWGLFDMHGNVWEWCWDWFLYVDYGDYASGAVTDPQGPRTGAFRVLRGGSWFNVSQLGRAADRTDLVPDFRNDGSGFRVARTP